ncbi:hypothetical protein ACFLYF_05010 [Chloroflexota bacterium]
MTTQAREPNITKSQRLSNSEDWGEIHDDWYGLACLRFKSDLDFISFRSKGKSTAILYFPATKRDLIQSQRQTFFDLWKSSRTDEDIVLQAEKYYGYLYSTHKASKVFPEPITVTKSVKASYIDKEAIDHLLNHIGRQVLSRIISLIEKVSRENAWPLDKIEIRYVKDHDVKDWEYILIRLFIDSDFNTADGYLHDLYKKLDILHKELNTEEKDSFQRLFYYDVTATAVSIH